MRHRAGRGAKPKPVILPITIGAIVKAPITPDGGIVKPRPCVVISTDTHDPDRPILVVGLTTDRNEYDPQNTSRYDPELFIPMPYAHDGTAPTGFTVPCAAKATWVQPFAASQVRVESGRLPDKDVDDLIAKLKAFIRKRQGLT